MESKRFVLRKTLIGKNTVITFTNKKGETRKYGNYTNTNNLPTWAREHEIK